jgi:Flp pilus assembly pilin Flp
MMKNVWIRIRNESFRFWTETDGQDLVEYALLVAAIALGMIAAVRGIASALNSVYESISAAMTFTG